MLSNPRASRRAFPVGGPVMHQSRARLALALWTGAGAAAVPTGAHAAQALDGTIMAWPWALPFVGLLLTIALGPLLFATIWHRHYGKIAAAWAMATLAAIAAFQGTGTAVHAFLHTMLTEYLSF